MRNLKTSTPTKAIPRFRRRVANDETETRLFFGRSSEKTARFSICSTRFTFVNERWKTPGFPGTGAEFRRVALATPSEGLLGHASILTVTSTPPHVSRQTEVDSQSAECSSPPPQNVRAQDSGERGSRDLHNAWNSITQPASVCHLKWMRWVWPRELRPDRAWRTKTARSTSMPREIFRRRVIQVAGRVKAILKAPEEFAAVWRKSC